MNNSHIAVKLYYNIIYIIIVVVLHHIAAVPVCKHRLDLFTFRQPYSFAVTCREDDLVGDIVKIFRNIVSGTDEQAQVC